MTETEHFVRRHVGKCVVYNGVARIILGYARAIDNVIIDIGPNGWKTSIHFDPLEIEVPSVSGCAWYATLAELTTTESVKTTKPVDFPHICQQCGAPAFVMTSIVDCSNATCRHASGARRASACADRR